MPVTIDITKDLRYCEGVAKGVVIGRREGREEGLEEKAVGMVTRMLHAGTFTHAQIAEFAGVDESFVAEVEQSLR